MQKKELEKKLNIYILLDDNNESDCSDKSQNCDKENVSKNNTCSEDVVKDGNYNNSDDSADNDCDKKKTKIYVENDKLVYVYYCEIDATEQIRLAKKLISNLYCLFKKLSDDFSRNVQYFVDKKLTSLVEYLYIYSTYKEICVGSCESKKDMPISISVRVATDMKYNSDDCGSCHAHSENTNNNCKLKSYCDAKEAGSLIYYLEDFISLRFNQCNPDTMPGQVIEYINRYVDKAEYVTEVINVTEEFGLIHAVGKASQYPPKLMIIKFGEKSIDEYDAVLIGKGVTFDTGGVNIKTRDSTLKIMHIDKAGAVSCVAMGINLYKKYNRNVVVVLPIVDNAIGSYACRPGDIYASYSKQYVKIGNTDAEGRLILADAVSYACKNLKFKLCLVAGTLTGAAPYIIGDDAVICMANKKCLEELTLKLGPDYGEKYVALNIKDKDIHARMEFKYKGKTALINDCEKEMAYTAAAGIFVYKFFEFKNSVPYMHLDIAALRFEDCLMEIDTPAFNILACSAIIDAYLTSMLDRQN